MFNRKSIYALNKKDPDAIVYMDANEVIIRLTREDFASEEEFLKWKSWSDGNYHTEDNQDVVEGKHNTSIDDLSEAALSIPAIDVVKLRSPILYLRRPSIPFCRLCFAMLFSRPQIFFQLGLDFLAGLQRCDF